MAIDFPNSPTTNQTFTDQGSGTTYIYDGKKWISSLSADYSTAKLANTSNTFYAGFLNFPPGSGISIGVGTPITDIYVNGSSAAVINTLSDGATVTPTFDSNNNFTLTIAGNRTFSNPANPTVGQSGVIFIIQDGTGGRTLSWGSQWRFQGNTAPTLSTAAGAVDMLVYTVRTSSNISCQLINNIG